MTTAVKLLFPDSSEINLRRKRSSLLRTCEKSPGCSRETDQDQMSTQTALKYQLQIVTSFISSSNHKNTVIKYLPIRDGRRINILFVLLFSLKLIFRQNQLMHIRGIPGLADHLLMKHIFIFTDMWWMIKFKTTCESSKKKTEQISAEKWCNPSAHPGWVSNKENSLFSSNSKVGYITVQTARDDIRPHVAFLLTVATTKQKLESHIYSLILPPLTFVKCQIFIGLSLSPGEYLCQIWRNDHTALLSYDNTTAETCRCWYRGCEDQSMLAVKHTYFVKVLFSRVNLESLYTAQFLSCLDVIPHPLSKTTTAGSTSSKSWTTEKTGEWLLQIPRERRRL